MNGEILCGLAAGLAMVVTIYRVPMRLQLMLWFDACRLCRRLVEGARWR